MVNKAPGLNARARLRRGFTRSETSRDDSGQPRLIPQPFAPVYPALSLGFCAPSGWARPASVIDNGPAVWTQAGRNAIALALRDARIGPGHQVLVPAFHCVSMVAPIVAAGAEPVFFPITDDLGVDTDQLTAGQLAGPRCKAVIAVHYFGFPQDFRPLRRFCDEHGLIFIEDCCHAFFGSIGARSVGALGDYAVASARKFFPVQEGGVMVSRRGSITRLPRIRPGGRALAKSALNSVEKSLAYGRLRFLEPVLSLIGMARRQPVAPPLPVPHEADLMEGVGREIDDLLPTALSRAIMRRAPLGHMAFRRRENYLYMAEKLAATDRPIKFAPTLARGAVPYMLPLEIENLAALFPALEDAELPMLRFGQFRWPGAEGVCAVADRMAATGLQLACHDGLTRAEMDLTIERLLAII